MIKQEFGSTVNEIKYFLQETTNSNNTKPKATRIDKNLIENNIEIDIEKQ